MMQKMIQGGYPENKLHTISNFISDEKSEFISKIPVMEKEMAYAYIGRLSIEKGIEDLLKAAVRLPYKLYIAGRGPLERVFKKRYTSANIIFLGHVNAKEIVILLKKVQFSIIPSICYENNPLGVIESLCCGTPVLGRNIGGIPELLKTNICNSLFNDSNDLESSIVKMFTLHSEIERKELSTVAYNYFSAEQYYQKWLEVVQKISS